MIVIHRQEGLRPCVTICIDDTVGFAWPNMQSYLYSIIIDCIYYDVGNETTTEIIIVVERINEDYLYCYNYIMYITCKERAQILKLRRVVYRSANVRLYSVSREDAEFQWRR